MADFTEKETELLPEFRKMVADIIRPDHDDYFMVKWIRARRHNLDKAEAMYRKSMKWREENNVDKLLDEFQIPEIVQKYYPGGICGQDKEGRPIWIDPLGQLDCRGMMFSVKRSDLVKTMVYRLEKMYKLFEEISEREGRRIDQCIHLLDMEGFGSKHIWKPAAELYIEILNTMEANYPETLKTSYVINVPKAFSMAWTFLKQFLPEDTVKKFLVFEKGRWQETVFKAVDPAEVPVFYSGTRMDSDGNEKCESLIGYGGDVPQDLYGDKTIFFPKNVELKKQTIGRGSAFRVDCDITDSNVGLRYVFSTEGGEIEFGVYKKTVSGKQKVKDMECREPLRKVSCHIVPEDGTTICDKPGTYVLVFDNTGSYFKQRKLTYYVEEIVGDGSTREVEPTETATKVAEDQDKVQNATNGQTAAASGD